MIYNQGLETTYYEYNSHSLVLVDLLNITKPYYSKDGTMRGPTVFTFYIIGPHKKFAMRNQ